jgi:iron(II)-dependent oxidoreductase
VSRKSPPDPKLPEGPSSPGNDEIAEWVLDARARTAELVEDLDDGQLAVPQLPIVNPLLWEIGHLAWFQERFVLRQACQEDPILDFADALWDSATVPHDTRWRLRLPSRSEVLRYMAEVANRVAERVAAPGSTDVVRHFALYTVYHYDMHTEAITYTRQTLGYTPPERLSTPGPVSVPGVRERSAPLEPAGGDVEIRRCRYLLGATRAQPFAFDNEKWAHPVELRGFGISRHLVTQAQFAEFVQDGGYDRAELWSTGGLAWRELTGARQPVYWRKNGTSGWVRRHFDAWVPLEENLPVVHVNHHEADAYCRWARRRLPTEAEWELVASTAPQQLDGDDLVTERRTYPWGDEPPDARRANLDWLSMGTSRVFEHPSGDSAHGCRQLVGGVWEWTSSTFWPYPNFERDAYTDNSVPWFGSRKVLRGGSWATRSRLVRNTLRNYFTPDRRDVIAGFRTCALEK